MSPRLRAVVSLSLLALPGCTDGPTDTPPSIVVARLELRDALPPDAYVGRALAPVVRAYDAEDRWVAGARLHFASARGTTTLESDAATTDGQGYARPGTWRLPTRPTVDTLVVTVAGAPGVAALRIPIAVRAGPISRWTALAPATGGGTVLQPFSPSDVFQAFDPYDNPVSFATARIETTPGLGASRVAATLAADTNGTFRISDWMPRTLGTYTLRLVPGDGGPASPTLTRDVRQPACAPTAAIPTLPTTPAVSQGVVHGVLRDDPTAACADTLDRWAVGADSTRWLGFLVRQTLGVRLVPFRVIRAGSADAAAIIVPDSASIAAGGRPINVLVPRGEYELVVGAGVTTRLPYDISWADFGTGLGGSSTYALPGVEIDQGLTTAEQPAPEVGVPDAVGLLVIVPMRDPARRRLRVSASFTGDWQPVLAVSARRDGSTARDSLAADRAGGSDRTLVVDVPVAYQEALVYVLQPKPLPAQLSGRFRLRIE